MNSNTLIFFIVFWLVRFPTFHQSLTFDSPFTNKGREEDEN